MLFGSLALYLLPFTSVQVAESREHDLNNAFGNGELPQPFHELLNALPEETIHAALKTDLLPKYQDGVYQDDRTAVARVHDENPSLASRLLAAAKLEFVRRQADNSTTTTAVTTTDGTGSTTTSTSTSQTPTPTPTSTTTTPTSTATTPIETTDGASTTSSTIQAGGSTTTATSATDGNGGSGSTQSTSQTDTGATTAAGSEPASSSSASQSSAVVVPVDISTTDSSGQPTVISTSAVVASASVSAVVAVTTTDSKGSTTVSSKTVAGAVVQTVNSLGQTVSSTVPVSVYKPETTPSTSGGKINTVVTDSSGQAITLSGVTSGQVIRTHDAQGHTFVTTFTPGGGRISQLVLVTTNAPDGQAVTLTSFVAAPSAVESSNDGAPSGGPSNTRNPSLQSGLAAPNGVGREFLAVVGAGMLGAAALI